MIANLFVSYLSLYAISGWIRVWPADWVPSQMPFDICYEDVSSARWLKPINWLAVIRLCGRFVSKQIWMSQTRKEKERWREERERASELDEDHKSQKWFVVVKCRKWPRTTTKTHAHKKRETKKAKKVKKAKKKEKKKQKKTNYHSLFKKIGVIVAFFLLPPPLHPFHYAVFHDLWRTNHSSVYYSIVVQCAHASSSLHLIPIWVFDSE